MIKSESYRGREQTYIKHKLLAAYLERLFMIIGLFQPVIRYVDCFSGPWKEKDETLQDTSIGISLEIMKKCRDGIIKMGKTVSFQALFIEKDKAGFEKLKDHLIKIKSPGIELSARQGDFFELRDEILSWCGERDFAFFFIDPTGWKKVVEISTLAPLLKRPNSEFLINFMYDFLLRTHTQDSFQEDMREIFGETPKTMDMTSKQREKFLIDLYRSRLKQIAPSIGGKPRVAHVPILYPLRDRSFYHLVYLTRHPRGIVVFMEESEKLDFVQRQVREQAKKNNRERKTGQLEFSFYNDVNPETQVDLKDVKAYWLSKLSLQPRSFGIKQLADMIEETGWFESDFQTAFKELTEDGVVANLDDKTNRRRKRFVHFDAAHSSGEQLMRLQS